MDNITKNIILAPFNIMYRFNPESTLKILFKLKLGYKLNLEQPTTYNEKLQWIKLYDKNPLMTKCCDKYTVRSYVESCGCKNILNELYWEGFNPEEIPFDKLPNKFVIKATHGSTFNIICKDKIMLDKDKVILQCKKWLKSKFLTCYGEWFYGVEKPRIIVEKYIESDDGKQLKDYKVFCFNGKAEYIRVDSERFTDNHGKDMYDREWKLLDEVQMGYKNSGKSIDKPKCLDEILEYAEKLSKPFLHARVDFYIVKDEIIFGEITFTNGAGFDKIKPHSFDVKMGSHLKILEEQ